MAENFPMIASLSSSSGVTTSKWLLAAILAVFPLFTGCTNATKDGSGDSRTVDVPHLMRARTCQPVLDWNDPIPWESRWRIFEACQAGRLSVAQAREEMRLLAAARTAPPTEQQPTPENPPTRTDDDLVGKFMQTLRELAELDDIESQRISTSPML